MSIRPIRPLPAGIRWFRGDEPAGTQPCSVCGTDTEDERGPPLLMFKHDGSALLRFCRACSTTYFGIMHIPEEEE